MTFPFFWLGAEAEEAAMVAEMNELLLREVEATDLTDPQSDE